MSMITVTFQNKAEVQDDCRKWAEEIGQEYEPDAIVFIAKSGFLFAEAMAEKLQVPMADVSAGRPGNDGKDIIARIVPKMPRFLLALALSSKAQICYNRENSERNVVVSERLRKLCDRRPKRVLVVDDSIDTGWTVLKVKEELARMMSDAEIRIAGYCVLTSSEDMVRADYFRYKNRIVVTATSRYSAEYRFFLDEFEEWKNQFV